MGNSLTDEISQIQQLLNEMKDFQEELEEKFEVQPKADSRVRKKKMSQSRTEEETKQFSDTCSQYAFVVSNLPWHGKHWIFADLEEISELEFWYLVFQAKASIDAHGWESEIAVPEDVKELEGLFEKVWEAAKGNLPADEEQEEYEYEIDGNIYMMNEPEFQLYQRPGSLPVSGSKKEL